MCYLLGIEHKYVAGSRNGEGAVGRSSAFTDIGANCPQQFDQKKRKGWARRMRGSWQNLIQVIKTVFVKFNQQNKTHWDREDGPGRKIRPSGAGPTWRWTTRRAAAAEPQTAAQAEAQKVTSTERNNITNEVTANQYIRKRSHLTMEVGHSVLHYQEEQVQANYFVLHRTLWDLGSVRIKADHLVGNTQQCITNIKLYP